MNSMKTCNKCKNSKELCEFGKKHDTKDGLSSICKKCNIEKVNKWKLKNPEKSKQTSSVASKKWYYNNKEARKNSMSDWQKSNLAKCRSIEANRRSAKIKRTPKWLTELQFQQIEMFYDAADKLSKEFGVKMEVDHIMPLQGKNLSGLHVPWNLQVIPASQNKSKGNR